jgi:IPT/TIG domain-containing protein
MSPPPPPPQLSGLNPTGGPGGTQVRLTGTGFGTPTAASRVYFAIRGGPPAVAAKIERWTDTEITAVVPPLAAFGTGGPLDAHVQVDDRAGAPLRFDLHEEQPPKLLTIRPAQGLEDTMVTVPGEHFGRWLDAAHHALTFATGTASGIPAAIDSWEPTTITARVPKFELLGPAGVKAVRVHAPWGDSAPDDFELGERPRIDALDPPHATPLATVEIHGGGFEATGGFVELVDPQRGDTLRLTDTRWTPNTIAVVLPSPAELGTTGDKRLRVTTRWSSVEAALVVTQLGSITAWTRLEMHARADDLNRGVETGLQAAVYDALWLLGRQWQMRELDGEDAGSPITARLTAETAALARWRPLESTKAAAAVPPGQVPLEALVEHERVLPPRDRASGFADYRLAVDGGLQWLRTLAARLPRRQDIDGYRREYLRVRALRPPTRNERAKLDAATLRFIDLAVGRVPDGARLYVELQMTLPENGGHVPTEPAIRPPDHDAFRRAVVDWFGWWDGVFSQGTTGGQTWDAARMEYRFAVSAETSKGEVVLTAPDYDGRRLDWYSLDAGGGPSLRARPEKPSKPGPQPITRTLVPVPVSYPGMPAPRYWEMEDARVDFGSVAAGPTDLARLLFVEFATVYGNDWFLLPVDELPVGSLCRIDSLIVTDTFGRQTTVTSLEQSLQGFRLFDMGDRPDLLFVADALPSTFESAPLEEVLLLRDELANLAWGVERVVSGLAGTPVNRTEVWQQRAQQPPATGDEPPLAYRLSTAVPDYWIPFVLKLERDRAVVTARWLERAALRDPVTGQLIGPQGELLRHDAPTVRVHDHVVGREGVRLLREWQYGRGPDGRTHLWRTRRRDVGRGEGSSGLRFDVVERRPGKSPSPPA